MQNRDLNQAKRSGDCCDHFHCICAQIQGRCVSAHGNGGRRGRQDCAVGQQRRSQSGGCGGEEPGAGWRRWWSAVGGGRQSAARIDFSAFSGLQADCDIGRNVPQLADDGDRHLGLSQARIRALSSQEQFRGSGGRLQRRDCRRFLLLGQHRRGGTRQFSWRNSGEQRRHDCGGHLLEVRRLLEADIR